MLTLIRHRIVYAFALLTLVSQVVFANGVLMVPNAYADESQLSHSSAEVDCHKVKPTQEHHCCDSTTAQSVDVIVNQSHNCDNDQPCQSDCGHCLFISFTGTLLLIEPWVINQYPDKVLDPVIPHFHSISTQNNLRPPIV